MTLSFKRNKHPSPEVGWKAYQERLRRQNMPDRRIRLGGRPWLFVMILILALAGIWLVSLTGINEETGPSVADAVLPPQTFEAAELIEKTDVHIFLDKSRLVNLKENPIQVDFDGRPYQVNTSLNMDLQQYLLKRLDRVNSRFIGIVAMAPDTGRLLAMAGFNKIDPDRDPCLTAEYPAASIFKIITAAAAIEEKGYSAGSKFKFNGAKHTLYKRQLTDKTNRHTNSITLRDSFAQSVNPVFGKIGAMYLEPQALFTYGDAFAFNEKVVFELPWPTSQLLVNNDSYYRAEVASGFNYQTTISPIHGAVIVSAVVNGGIPVEPTLVDRIVDSSGTPVYKAETRFLPAAVSPDTAEVLEELMATTVISGTARKAFRGHRRSKILSRLRLGGKTGSISNRAHDARFDWFAGFATEKKGTEKIVVSVMVAHEEYIGTRAGQYARMVFEHYFKDYFAKKTKKGDS